MKKVKSMSFKMVLVFVCTLIIFTACSVLAVASGEIVINFPSIWVGKDSKAEVMDELITQFNKNNKGKIKVIVEEIANYDAYEEKMQVSVATGQVPDVFTIKAGSKAELFFQSGKLMDLTGYMNDGWKDRFSTLHAAIYNDRILAIPYEFGVTPVLYNSALLEEVGYTEFPKTYEEFFKMCDALKAAGITPMSQMTGDNAWTSMLWYSQLLAAIGGPEILEKDFTDPAYLKAAKIMKKMFDYTTSDAVGASAAVAAGHFLNERTAMLMNGSWFIGRIKTEGVHGLYDKVRVAPAPMYKGGQGKEGGYLGFAQALIVASKQKNKAKEEAVIKFLKYLTEPVNVKRLSISSGSLFVVKTEINEGDNVDRLQAAMIKQSSQAPYIVPHFNMSVKPTVATEFPQILSALVLDVVKAEEFIESLKAADRR